MKKWWIIVVVLVVIIIVGVIVLWLVASKPIENPKTPNNSANDNPHNCLGVNVDVIKSDQENNTYILRRGATGDELYNVSIIVNVGGNTIPESDYFISNVGNLEKQLSTAKITFKYPINGNINIILWPKEGCPSRMLQ